MGFTDLRNHNDYIFSNGIYPHNQLTNMHRFMDN